MGVETRIRIVSVDDHPLMREGIAAIIANEADMLMVAQASNGQEAIEQFRQHQPDVTLMDLRMPGMSGVAAIEAIRAESPEARIVVLTTFNGDVEIRRALAAGAWGYVLKSVAPNELLGIIRRVGGGKKQIPTELAERLAEHVSDEPKGPSQAHHGKARCDVPYAGRGDRGAPRHRSALSTAMVAGSQGKEAVQ